MSLDLHELANMPGFGNAQEAVKDAGHWDDHATEGEYRKWLVKLSAQVTRTASVTVEARSAEEAEEKAMDMADDRSVKWVDADEPRDCLEADARQESQA